MPKCPHCRCTDSQRSRRRWWERILVFVLPYRCLGCDKRLYGLAK
jgi:hypothetical protein